MEAFVKKLEERNDRVNNADHGSDKHDILIVFPSPECMSDISLYKVTEASAIYKDRWREVG